MTSQGVLVDHQAGRTPLLPDRHEPDFFLCDVLDAAPKGDMASMANPIFSLSTKPDRRPRRYEQGDSFVEINPSTSGLATIHDRDILIYCISQAIAALNAGRPIARTVRFKAYDLLRATNRVTSGEGYAGLKAAMERLRGTTISTNIITGGKETFEVFGLIDKAKIVRETRDGRMEDVEITLSDWIFRAIEHKEVLTLNRAYFRLRKPLERRLYELARKHCGHQQTWRIGLKNAQDKCGSASTEREFRRLVKNICEQDATFAHFPDYSIHLSDDDMIIFRNRRGEGATPPAKATQQATLPIDMPPADIRLKSDTHAQAKEAAPRWDIYYLEQRWRSWMADGNLEPPKDPDKAFVGFCKRFFERNGPPK